ncbi:hypothetical protein [Burkholderia anthina]|uniref:hypothetical protein n=1 Tax=Burkholderia anthina TaxID=179879 RepID=UPI00158979FB|nr:hypothetical protein [Burkholderia anthina]
MNTQARVVSLPKMAASVAAVAVTVPFLYSLYFLRASSLSDDVLAMRLVAFIGNLVFRTGLVFLIVQLHGERRGQLAFRRPALLLAIYGACLLGWQFGQGFLFQALMRSLSDTPAYLRLMFAIVAPLSAMLYSLVAWLTWRLVTRMLRNDVLPAIPSGNVARRIAGLAAWLFACVLLTFAPQVVYMLVNYFDGDFNLIMLKCVGMVVVPAAIVYVGTRSGLPRNLGRLHGWRWLGASLAAMASISLLAYGALHAIGNVLDNINVMSRVLTIIVLAGAGVAYRMCFRAFYAAVGRSAADTSQGMQSS